MPLEDRIEEEVQQPIVEETPKLVVDVSEPEEDDEGEGQAAATPLDRRGRRAHYRELKQNHEELKAKYEALERRISEGQQRPAQQEQRPGEPPELAPIRSRLKEIDDAEDDLMQTASSAQLTPEQAKRVQQRYRALQNERSALIADGRAIQRQARQPQQEQADPVGALLRSEFPEVYADEGLSHLAQYNFNKLVKAGRDPRDVETSREALRRTRNAAGIGQRPTAPTAADRARNSSVAARAGAAGSQSGGWTPSKAQERTAVAWAQVQGHNVDPAEAARLWYHKVGKKRGLV